MEAGYRVVLAGALALLLFVVFGWGLMTGVTLSAPAPNPTANSQQSGPANAVANAAQNIGAAEDQEAERLHRLKYEAECERGDDKRNSDLCAQWKAADAATDSARWTYWGNWIGGVSGVLVLIALGLAYQANRIARETARRQLRAYVNVQKINCSPKQFTPGEEFKVEMTMKNSGQTPAHKVELIWIVGFVPAAINYDFPLPDDDDEARSVATLGAGETMPTKLAVAVRQLDIDGFNSGTARFWVFGRITYEDIFGGRWHSNFRSEMDANFTFRVCEEGNDST